MVAIEKLMREFEPNFIIHCAAERRPDIAAQNPSRTTALNVTSTKILAEECERIASAIQGTGLGTYLDTSMNSSACTMIYISTDYVFDGGIHTGVQPPYSPSSKTHPVNDYGVSKLAGEKVVREGCHYAKSVIIRVPVLYATDCDELEESASLTVANALKTQEGGSMKVKVDDWSMRFPTSVDDVAAVLQIILDTDADAVQHRCVHVSSPEGCTKYHLVKVMGEILNQDTSHVEADGEPPVGAVRPKDTQLDCTATWEDLGLLGDTSFEFTSLRDGMAHALERFKGIFTNV
jgi:dTDP-4-dehydrorhamnose reductase